MEKVNNVVVGTREWGVAVKNLPFGFVVVLEEFGELGLDKWVNAECRD